MSGKDSIDIRSECFVNLLFRPAFLLVDFLLCLDKLEPVSPVKTVSWVTVVSDRSLAVCDSVDAEDEVLNVSTEAMVESLCAPVIGARRLAKVGGGGISSYLTGSETVLS